MPYSGSDSAPHPFAAKRSVDGRNKAPAGVYTQSFVTQYILLALQEAVEGGLIQEDEVTLERLAQFLGGFGRQFYRLPDPSRQRIVLERKLERIPDRIGTDGGPVEVALWRADDPVFSLRWKVIE